MATSIGTALPDVARTRKPESPIGVIGAGACILPKSNAEAASCTGRTPLSSTRLMEKGAEKMKPRDRGSMANPTLSCAQMTASGFNRMPTYCS